MLCHCFFQTMFAVPSLRPIQSFRCPSISTISVDSALSTTKSLRCVCPAQHSTTLPVHDSQRRCKSNANMIPRDIKRLPFPSSNTIITTFPHLSNIISRTESTAHNDQITLTPMQWYLPVRWLPLQLRRPSLYGPHRKFPSLADHLAVVEGSGY